MAAGAVIAAAAAAAKRRKDDADAIARSLEPWARLAKERKLAFTSTSGAPAIEGELLGVKCRAWIELDRNGFGHTRITAVPLTDVAGKVFLVPNPGGALGFLKHAFTQDVSVGDEAFDEAFLVRAEPESLAPALLGPSLRAFIAPLAVRKLTSFVYEHGKVELHFPDVEVQTEWVAAALDAAVEAARWVPPRDAPFR